MLVAIVFAAFAGLAWIAIPAFFRARFNTNEVVSTILANYVAVLITSYLTINVFKRPGGLPETPPILPSAYLPELFSLLQAQLGPGHRPGARRRRRTSSSTARAAAMRSPRWAPTRSSPNMAGSTSGGRAFSCCSRPGAVGGLAGGIEALGVHHRFMEGFAPGFGFDGVIAALLANGSPIGTICTALFFGALRSGSLLLEVDTTASREIITVIQALIILAVSAQITFRRRAADSTAGERRWKF